MSCFDGSAFRKSNYEITSLALSLRYLGSTDYPKNKSHDSKGNYCNFEFKNRIRLFDNPSGAEKPKTRTEKNNG